MKYLGIDYGSKRVGIAISDETASYAFAKAVLVNDRMLLPTIHQLCIDERVEAIILGESKDYHGKDNPIMKRIVAHKKDLEIGLGLPVYLEPEFMTSAQAEHIQGKTAMHDASAAALILQSYLDRQKSLKS